MPRDVGVVVVAAGRGTRLGGGVPKQFRTVAGVPLVVRAVEPFRQHPEVGAVVVVIPESALDSPPAELAGLRGAGLTLVAGGAERRDSVRLGLDALPPECATVLVHDGARPFVERDTIDRVIGVARAGEGAVAAVPVTDTLKRAAGSDAPTVEMTVPRDGLWRAQTPQGFPRPLLAAAHAAALRDGIGGTDDAALVERLGATVRLIPDSPRNFKVTSPEDFELAELWAASR